MLTMRFAALIAATLASTMALAQTPPRDPAKEELRAQIGAALTAVLGDSSRAVVERLSEVKPDGAISRNFDAGKVSAALFGRLPRRVASDCQTTVTPTKEADTGQCIIDSGDRDSETGAYTALAFSKNIGIGQIEFVRRAAFDPKGEALPMPVRLSDAEAYAKALQFLELVGVPKSEIPELPKGVPPPVRSLVVGTVDEKGEPGSPIAIQKVVSVPRAFAVPKLLTDPLTGKALDHVLAPGGALVAVGDGSVYTGIQFASVEGWSDAQMDPKLDPRLAKSTAALTEEITEDLYAEGVRKIGTLSVLIAFRRAYPNPDDPNPPLCPVCGLLLPAVQVIVSQLGADPTETSEKAFAAPGVVREYDLVDRTEQERAPR